MTERWKADQALLDLRAGLICAITANCYRDSKKRSDPFTPYDFGLPFLQETEVKKTKTEIEYSCFNRILAQTKKMGGKVTKRGRI